MLKIKEHKSLCKSGALRKQKSVDYLKSVAPCTNQDRLKSVQTNQRNVYHPCAKDKMIGSHILQQLLGKQKSEIQTMAQLYENFKKDSFKSSKFEREACRQLEILKEYANNQKMELQSLKEELRNTKNYNQVILKQNVEINNKLIIIESNYDNEVLRFGTTVQEFENEARVKQSQYLELMEDLTERRMFWEESLKKKQDIIMNMDKKISEYEIDMKKLLEQNNSLKGTIDQIKEEHCQKLQENNNKFDVMRKELEKRDENITLCRQEKEEMYQEKNKTIDELTCKIRRIENVFGQPVKSVPPLLNNASNVSSIQLKEQIITSDKELMQPTNKSYQISKEQENKLSLINKTNPKRRKLPMYCNNATKDMTTEDSDDEWISSRTMSLILPKSIRNHPIPSTAKANKNKSSLHLRSLSLINEKIS